jgi:hypothetical protein
MGITTLYYFLAFIIFIASFIGIQKWFELPQPKKDKVGLIVLSIFLSSLLMFILLATFRPTYLQSEHLIFIGMFFIFLLIVFTAFFVKWYNDKYNKKLNIGRIVIILCLTIFTGIYFVIRQQGTDEKATIIKNIELKTVVANITFDSHKPYFKDMTLADGQFLPMPEAMNNVLQVGDSIYKIKGGAFYTIVSAASKTTTKIEVKVHERVLGKAQ